MRAGASKIHLGGPGLKVERYKAQSLPWIAVVPFWTKTNGTPPHVRGCCRNSFDVLLVTTPFEGYARATKHQQTPQRVTEHEHEFGLVESTLRL